MHSLKNRLKSEHEEYKNTNKYIKRDLQSCRDITMKIDNGLKSEK